MGLMLLPSLLALTWIGMTLSPRKLAANRIAETKEAVTASARLAGQAKHMADNAPTNAAKSTLPVPPNRGITSATNAHPRPAPNRSYPYRRLISLEPRVSSSEIARPEQKNGKATKRK